MSIHPKPINPARVRCFFFHATDPPPGRVALYYSLSTAAAHPPHRHSRGHTLAARSHATNDTRRQMASRATTDTIIATASYTYVYIRWSTVFIGEAICASPRYLINDPAVTFFGRCQRFRLGTFGFPFHRPRLGQKNGGGSVIDTERTPTKSLCG